MTDSMRRRILRVNALFLVVVGATSLLLDLRAAFFGVGPQSALLRDAPHAAIGFVEAHGLATIIGVLLMRAKPSRSWHLTAAAVHVLLGASNLVFWQVFVAADVLLVGYVTTALHWLLVLVQLWAARSAPKDPAAGLAG